VTPPTCYRNEKRVSPLKPHESKPALRVRLKEATESFTAGRINITEFENAAAALRPAIEDAENVMATAVVTSPLAGILNRRDPAIAFWESDLETQRAVVRQLLTVQLKPAGRPPVPTEILTDPHGNEVTLNLDVDTVIANL